MPDGDHFLSEAMHCQMGCSKRRDCVRPSEHRSKLAIVCLVGLLGTESPGLAANWPGWRGPLGIGVSGETNLPVHWSTNENVRWRVTLPDRGNSTPVVWNDRVFITQAVGKERNLMCVNRADGKLLWTKGITSQRTNELTHATNPYCASSPVTDGEHVIVWFGSDGLHC